MTEIVFARTRYNYDSYTDFWKLVELSEFPVVYVDEIDRNANVIYLTAPFNGEHFQLEGDRKCKVVLWNLERPAGSGGVKPFKKHLHRHILNGYIDDVVVSDITLSNTTGFKFLPLGSHDGLGQPGDSKVYDYIHLMCYSNRRGVLFHTPDNPKSQYYGLKIAPNGWGSERHNRLQQSKFMLNVHQDTDMIMEPLRFALAAAYGLPILTETLYALSPPYIYGVYQFALPAMANVMMFTMKNYDVAMTEAAKLRDYVTSKFTFRSCVEKFL